MAICKERGLLGVRASAVLKAITLKEIERIFAVVDPMGISREAVVIPLRTEHPGRVRIIAGGKLEIVVDRERDFDGWIKDLEAAIRAVMERGQAR